MNENINDVLIVGGSYAGLSAAMSLGRALRKVLVIDSGKPCNRQTPHSHNFITHDGSTPAEIAEKARKQVLQYPTVALLNDTVVRISGTVNNFEALTASGKVVRSRKILFTAGIRDIMPDIPGFAECWGISVIHCPYCHGYEYHGQKTGLLMSGEHGFEFAKMIRNWTEQLTVLTNGKSGMTQEQIDRLQEKGVTINEKTIKEISHSDGILKSVVFEDSREEPFSALYSRLPFEQHTSLPETLGCEFTELGYIKTDDWKRTTVPGIYSAGDCTSPMRSVANAVGTGTSAEAFINHDMVAEEWSRSLKIKD